MDRSKLDAVITEIENAAYARGVADTLTKISAAVAGIKPAPPNDTTVHGAGKSLAVEAVAQVGDIVTPQNREPRQGSDQLKVLNDIRAHPGSRGIEIVKRLEGQVKERTLRTSIHRLKTRGAISQQGDKWFPVASPENDKDRLSIE